MANLSYTVRHCLKKLTKYLLKLNCVSIYVFIHSKHLFYKYLSADYVLGILVDGNIRGQKLSIIMGIQLEETERRHV